MELINANNIGVKFGGIPVLEDVNFELRSNEIHCLCGENGAGKSTLVKVFTGVNTHYTGQIYVEDNPVTIDSARKARELGIYAVQQHRDLVPTMNAVENMFMGSELTVNKSKQRIDFDAMREIAGKEFQKFGASINLDVPVGSLKVSEQGIIAICKALIADSKILLIDEASAPLDEAERKMLYDNLIRLRAEGKGIMYITHHLEEVFILGDRITVLRNGKKVDTVLTSDVDKNELIRMMTGDVKLYERQENGRKVEDDETPVIQFENVSSDHLKNINFEAFKGEIIGFAGLEGSYKDEIAAVAFGLSKLHSGSILYKGENLVSNRPVDAIRKGIGLVPKDRKNAGLILCRSVYENIILININRFKEHVINKKRGMKATQNLIKKLSIRTRGTGQLVEYLSGGNQQKVLISKWLEAKSEVLFLIEPTEGIDIGARADLYALFKEMAREGTTLVIFTSDIDELMVLSNRIYTMVEGEIINCYDIEDADKQQILSDILSRTDKAQGEVYYETV